MTSRPPPIPTEQRARHADALLDQTDIADPKDASDTKGNADLNLEQQGRHGNLHQNVETVHASTQAR